MYKFIYVTTLRHRFNNSISFDIRYTIKQFCSKIKNIPIPINSFRILKKRSERLNGKGNKSTFLSENE